jgi:hypothetical protein
MPIAGRTFHGLMDMQSRVAPATYATNRNSGAKSQIHFVDQSTRQKILRVGIQEHNNLTVGAVEAT